MWLDRSLIKQQAKQLIRHRTLKLFAITFVIMLILSIGQGVYLGVYFNNLDSLTNYYEDFQTITTEITRIISTIISVRTATTSTPMILTISAVLTAAVTLMISTTSAQQRLTLSRRCR